MDGAIEILRASKADAGDILSVQKQAFMQEADRTGDHGIAPLHQTIESVTEDFKTYSFFKAVNSGRIVGTVKCRMEGTECWLGRLAVLPHFQGRGIGRRLIMEAEKCFAKAERFILFTEQDNIIGLKLYGSAGYELTGELLADPRSGLKLVKLEKYNR